jgi:serine/threonine protein kinase
MTSLKGGEYVIESSIDKGGFGEVFKGHKIQSHSHPVVAIKKCKLRAENERRKIPDPKLEALILKDLCRWPDARQVIAEYYDSFIEGNYHYLVMELCEHGSIYEHILRKRTRPYNEDHTRDILLEVLTALDIIHGAGYVHRDLSPKNILIHSFSDDSVPKIKLVDFGLSKKIQHIKDTVAGTPGFFDPGMMRDGRSRDVDYYALGCVMFFMLTSDLISTRESKLTTSEVERKLRGKSVSDEAINLVLFLTSKANIENSYAIKTHSFFTKDALKAAQVHVSTIRKSIGQTEREPFMELQNRPSEQRENRDQRERIDWGKPRLTPRPVAKSHAHSLPTRLTAGQSKLSVASSDSPLPWPLPPEFKQIVKSVMVNNFGRALLFGNIGKFVCETLDSNKKCTYVGHLMNAGDINQELLIFKPLRKIELFNLDIHPEGIPLNELRPISRITRPIELEGNNCAKTMYSKMRSILKTVAEKPCRTWENPNLIPNSLAKMTWGGTIIVDLPSKITIRWPARAKGPPLRDYPNLSLEQADMLKNVHAAFTFNLPCVIDRLPPRRP